MGAQICINYLDELFYHYRFVLSYSDEDVYGHIWNAAHHSKPYLYLIGVPVIHLDFKHFIADAKKLLEYKHLEKDQRILMRPALLSRSSSSFDQEEDEMIPMELTQTVALERASSRGVLKLCVVYPRKFIGPL